MVVQTRGIKAALPAAIGPMLGDPNPPEYVQAMETLIMLARTDFAFYIQLFRPPGHTDFIFSKLHRFLASRVQKAVDQQIKRRQVVSVPPQHAKLD